MLVNEEILIRYRLESSTIIFPCSELYLLLSEFCLLIYSGGFVIVGIKERNLIFILGGAFLMLISVIGLLAFAREVRDEKEKQNKL